MHLPPQVSRWRRVFQACAGSMEKALLVREIPTVDNILCKVGFGLGNQRFAQNAEELDKASLVAKKVREKRSAYRVFSRAANESEFLLSRNALGKNAKKLLASIGLAGEQLGDGEGATSGSGNTLRNAFIMRLERRSPRR